MAILNDLLAESGKGKGRNLNRLGTIGLCALIYWQTKDLPTQAKAIETRLARVENRLGIAEQPSVFTNQNPVVISRK